MALEDHTDLILQRMSGIQTPSCSPPQRQIRGCSSEQGALKLAHHLSVQTFGNQEINIQWARCITARIDAMQPEGKGLASKIR